MTTTGLYEQIKTDLGYLKLNRAAEVFATVADDAVYPCFCTRREIREAVAAPHGGTGPSPTGTGPSAHGGHRYPGTCRNLTGARRTELARTREPALRLRADGLVRVVEDRVLGSVSFELDDFVVRRNDGVPAYHLVVVVDDAAQGVELVVRADDLAESAARQLVVYERLDLEPPAHAHVPLVLGPDGQRLAKRHGAVGVMEYQAAGYLPEGAEAGFFCARTGEGLLRFQGERGLKATGECDADTWRVLVEASWKFGDRLLLHVAPNLRGDDVTELQATLARLGFDSGRVDARRLDRLRFQGRNGHGCNRLGCRHWCADPLDGARNRSRNARLGAHERNRERDEQSDHRHASRRSDEVRPPDAKYVISAPVTSTTTPSPRNSCASRPTGFSATRASTLGAIAQYRERSFGA